MTKSKLLADYKHYLELCSNMNIAPNPESHATLYKSLVERYGYDAVIRHADKIERILRKAKSRMENP